MNSSIRENNRENVAPASSLPHSFASPLLLAQTEPHLILAPESLIVLEANEAFANALGVSRKDLVGRSVLQWIYNEEQDDFSRTVRMVGRHPLPPQIFFQWKIPGGKLLAMEITAWVLAVTPQTQVLALSARPRARGTIDASTRLPLPSALSRRMKTVG